MTCQVLFMYITIVGYGRAVALYTLGWQYLWAPKYFIRRRLPIPLIIDIILTLILLIAPVSPNYYVKN